MNFKKTTIPKNIILQKELKNILYYDPESGLFTWVNDLTNGVKAGELAGTVRGNTKLLYISINSTRYRADKLAFLYMTGIYPEYEIKHKNGARFINSWDNLEMEIKPEIKNYGKGGNKIRGVTCNSDYKVIIVHDGKRCYLGTYTDFDEAVCARYAGEQAYFGTVISPASEYVQKYIRGVK